MEIQRICEVTATPDGIFCISLIFNGRQQEKAREEGANLSEKSSNKRI